MNSQRTNARLEILHRQEISCNTPVRHRPARNQSESKKKPNKGSLARENAVLCP